MFLNNARIEDLEGIRFYEQDVLYDNNIYTDDIEITVKVKYTNSGFGFVLMNQGNVFTDNPKELLIFRIGQHEGSIIYQYDFLKKTLVTNSNAISIPEENLILTFSKKGRDITVSSPLNVTPIFSYKLNNNMFLKYNIGFYSNANNIIETTSISTPIPTGWHLNMHNTDGGYVKFTSSSFQFNDCYNSAELEQVIHLSAGKYYLRYTEQNNRDIKPYIFNVSNQSLMDFQKNILNYADNSFTLEIDSDIILKFKGHNGTIRNIFISDNLSDTYVQTTPDNETLLEGSFIELILNDVEYFEMKAIIENGDLEDINSVKSPYIFSNGLEKLFIKDIPIQFKEAFYYRYDVNNKTLTILNSNKVPICEPIKFKMTLSSIKLFYNINATISEFNIKMISNENISDVVEDIMNKKYVMDTITSPIIVTNTSYYPYDLSSSYREKYIDNPIITDSYIEYIFTNIEREVFEPNETILLTKPISTDFNSIRVYGIINKEKTNPSLLYRIKNDDINDISSYAPLYEDITNKIINIDYKKNKITLEKYDFDEIIVDYKKAKSYCINHYAQNHMYEIDISNDQEEYYLLFDNQEESSFYEQEKYVPLMNSSNEYMKEINTQYIVLRKE